ncbi:hypothetical protein SO802_008703 [Lithocarpus litseifolius]|uniref:Peptidase S8/S53 domain-containing protein n=1 Tax=Lithocarpus litseifolius TaxID=425828 RepID=A0AAW2DDJ8_9ROSI
MLKFISFMHFCNVRNGVELEQEIKEVNVTIYSEMQAELSGREKAANIMPYLDIDIFMKALGFEVYTITMVGDQMLKGHLSLKTTKKVCYSRNAVILKSVTQVNKLRELDDEKEILLYSYSHAQHGFSARLTPTQLSEIQNSSAHVATYPESFGRLLTIHTPKFLGLQQNYGIWPTASYGEGFSPSNCNRKLIGARSFSKGFRGAGKNISNVEDFNSARDFYGHGTHTASTAAGNHVPGVSYFGYARGTASGMAPRAHLAMYKVHWAGELGDIGVTDVLAGMEQAIHDGVDIISLSLGFNQSAYFLDAIAKGSLSATEKGIFVACAAGNEFNYATVENGVPWITTVGAGTLDQSFLATMTLENGLAIEGTSYFPESIFFTNLTLYHGKGNKSKELCKDTSLD